MPAAFLSSKLYLPPTRQGLIPRQRLVERLREGMNRPLILVTAPAGYGKTTLMGEWRLSVVGQNCPLAWLSLDEDDNDLLPYTLIIAFIAQRRKNTWPAIIIHCQNGMVLLVVLAMVLGVM